MRTGLERVVLCVALAAALPALATPAEDHQRGLLAYQRGDVSGAMQALGAPARGGHAPSQTLLAYILERADFAVEAAQLWRDAAAQGDAEAHAGLANLLLTGRGVAKDEKLALQHFSEAAARGHAAATEIVATAWLTGQMGARPEQQPELARAAVLRAAQQGHLPSADALVQAYRGGRWGLAADEREAQAWLARAAAWRQQRAAPMAAANPDKR